MSPQIETTPTNLITSGLTILRDFVKEGKGAKGWISAQTRVDARKSAFQTQLAELAVKCGNVDQFRETMKQAEARFQTEMKTESMKAAFNAYFGDEATGNTAANTWKQYKANISVILSQGMVDKLANGEAPQAVASKARQKQAESRGKTPEATKTVSSLVKSASPGLNEAIEQLLKAVKRVSKTPAEPQILARIADLTAECNAAADQNSAKTLRDQLATSVNRDEARAVA